MMPFREKLTYVIALLVLTSQACALMHNMKAASIGGGMAFFLFCWACFV